MIFLYFHVLSRSIRWSSNPTSSEIPRVDGEPQSAQSWVCISKKIWSFPAEVGLPWTSLSLPLPPPGFGPTDVWGWGAVLNSKEAALIPDTLIFLREHKAWLLSLTIALYGLDFSPQDFFCCQFTGTNHFVQKHGLHGTDGPTMGWLCWWSILATNRKNTKWDG